MDDPQNPPVWTLVESIEPLISKSIADAPQVGLLDPVFQKYGLDTDTANHSSSDMMWCTHVGLVEFSGGTNQLAEVLDLLSDSGCIDIYLRAQPELRKISVEVGGLSLLRFICGAEAWHDLPWNPRVQPLEISHDLGASLELLTEHLDEMLNSCLLGTSS